MADPLFGIVPAGLPLITSPSQSPSPTSLLYALPTSKHFTHITVLLLPSVSLPAQTAAAIYLATAQDVVANGGAAKFRFLGAIGPGKESAVFKISSAETPGGLVLGVEIEPEDAVARQMQELAASRQQGGGGGAGGTGQPPTAVLAQRIIQNAFNFLTSFSGTAGPGGVEVVPLKAFEEWWKKFESRVRADPSFLEKQAD
ncbi:hypothetical protein V2G26_009991 [Clonostachys chloroleuca]|uniref:Hikeshi-like domain-containing protein n=1 Tax=Clonostachys chloroleuca TaxID=1926264 RepID=A0AA35M053_9HYPO|nr:unnamed protein product [Clonostachys chloroleuca]